MAACSIVEQGPNLAPDLNLKGEAVDSSDRSQIQGNQSPRPVGTLSIPPTWTPATNDSTILEPSSNENPTAAVPEIAPGTRTYIVQAGDTLGEIAKNYNVTIEALVTANGIDDPDRIEVGQVLVIP